MPEIKAYTAEKIFTGDQWITGQAVITDGITITGIVPLKELPAGISTTSFDHSILAPAFVDIQVYGAMQRLFSAYPETATLETLAAYCSKYGTACCLPTVATNDKEVIFRCIDAMKSFLGNGGKGIAGIHLEGPWLNPEKRGAHIESFIHSPTVNEVEELLGHAEGCIRMITLAPEVCNNEIIQLLISHNIVLSAGHSNASYEEAMKAFDSGLSLVTHLFNAMSPFSHRQPGLVGAVLDHDRIGASIIPDGHHVDFASIRIAKKILGPRLFVITDAVTETHTGPYRHSSAGDKYVADGILSGSALTMAQGLINLIRHCSIPAGEALRMCSLYPARAVHIEETYGSISAGMHGRMLVLNKEFEFLQITD
jgi:N-acetylglucosamine-6-phosphate deacetylase